MPNNTPEPQHDNWPANLTDPELDHALNRLLAEITARKGPAAHGHIQDAVMRRSW